ncbi:MAG TPA: FG-GAP-like repeat-containing protein [Chloroflexota bacterium]|jgi:hypothetical protein
MSAPVLENERAALSAQIEALRARLARLEAERPAPNPPITVGFLGLLALQGAHEVEHVVQVVQRYLLRIPDGNGVLGHVFDIEPVHLAYNLAFLWILVLLYRIVGAHRPQGWTRGPVAWWLLSATLLVQGYHVVEHLFKIVQYLDTGRNGTPGILGNAFDLVWLHFTFNTIEMAGLVAAFVAGRFYREAGADLGVLWRRLSAARGRGPWPSGGGPRLSRRGLLAGVGGVAFAAGAGYLATTRRPRTLVLPTFADVTQAAGITFRHRALERADAIQAGVAFFDFDGDGRPDILLTNANGPNALYRNNGDGTFSDVAAAAGVADPDGVSIGVACADYDNDGRCDLLVTRLGGGLKLYRNRGDGTFADVTAEAGLALPGGHGASAAWADFDGDGHLDLYVTYWLDSVPPGLTDLMRTDGELRVEYTARSRGHRLYRNNGDGTFSEVSQYLGLPPPSPGLAVGFVDYDDDGRPDLYVVNDMGRFVQPNKLFHNDGPTPDGGWRFSEVGHRAGVDAVLFGMGIALGDYDGDGRLDMYATNMGSNQLFHNRGDGTFEPTTNRAGVGRGTIRGEDSVGWGTAFFDFDNDGNLDLYFTAGVVYPMPPVNGVSVPDQPNAMFHNRGDGTFRDVSRLTKTDSTGCGRGLAVADFDGDGFLDVLVANYGQPPVLYQNSGNANRWLQVRLIGTRSNRDGIGARLTLTAGGRAQVREVASGTSFLSQHSLIAHFGLGQLERAEALEIRWPSGARQRLTDLAANRLITVTEPA